MITIPLALVLTSGVKGLMVGRAALLNPWVFSEIHAGFNAESYERPSEVATIDLIERYLELLQADLPEKAVIGRMKQLISQVTRRIRKSKFARKEMLRCKTVLEIEEKLQVFREYLIERELKDGPTERLSSRPEYESALMRR